MWLTKLLQVSGDSIGPPLRVHKVILALHSPMLHGMFEANMAEIACKFTTIAYSRQAVEKVIDYVYGPEAALETTCTDLQLMKEVAEPAGYYQIEPLKQHYDRKLSVLAQLRRHVRSAGARRS